MAGSHLFAPKTMASDVVTFISKKRFCMNVMTFSLESQHPQAGTTFSTLAAKYKTPARMWHHGIHYFLECLRRNPGVCETYASIHIHRVLNDGAAL